MGAWIEIARNMQGTDAQRSLLSWERGLKFETKINGATHVIVAPLVGAWIEISVSGA